MSQSIDNEDIKRLQKIISACNKKIKDLVTAMSMAKVVIEHDSEDRKNLLARHLPFDLKSAAAAEQAARQSPKYQEAYQEHKKSLEAAYAIDFQWKATTIRLDSARSLLAVSRETLRNFQE